MADQCKTGPEQANQFTLEAKLAAAGDTPVVVEFESPWCEHCQEAKPLVAQATQELCGKAKVLKVDATGSPKLMDTYQVDGFPTLLLFHRGQVVKRLDGIESVQEIVNWVLGKGKKR